MIMSSTYISSFAVFIARIEPMILFFSLATKTYPTRVRYAFSYLPVISLSFHTCCSSFFIAELSYTFAREIVTIQENIRRKYKKLSPAKDRAFLSSKAWTTTFIRPASCTRTWSSTKATRRRTSSKSTTATPLSWSSIIKVSFLFLESYLLKRGKLFFLNRSEERRRERV